MAFNAAGQLIVVGTGNDDINIYDVTDPLNPVCVVANTTFGNVDPVAVLAHSDGFIYVATQGDDRIYRFPGSGVGAGTVIFNNTGLVQDPTALLEMPDGTLLVASDTRGAVVHITTGGALVGTTNFFISDIFTNLISDMIILPGDQ
jgi:glucose/arabinose dehydrogenase